MDILHGTFQLGINALTQTSTIERRFDGGRYANTLVVDAVKVLHHGHGGMYHHNVVYLKITTVKLIKYKVVSRKGTCSPMCPFANETTLGQAQHGQSGHLGHADRIHIGHHHYGYIQITAPLRWFQHFRSPRRVIQAADAPLLSGIKHKRFLVH